MPGARPRTEWLRPLWERARRVHQPYLFCRENLAAERRLGRRRPASPGQVLALVSVADGAERLDVPRLRHPRNCTLAGQTVRAARGPGLCTCGLTALHEALRRLRELA